MASAALPGWRLARSIRWIGPAMTLKNEEVRGSPQLRAVSEIPRNGQAQMVHGPLEGSSMAAIKPFCSECGGSITLVGGRAKTSRSEYGCSLHAQRGHCVCRNDLLIRCDHFEEQIIGGLQEKVLREEAIDYVVAALQEESQQRHEAINADLQSMRGQRQRIEANYDAWSSRSRWKMARPAIHGSN
jgi:hypothetical protein